jgi:hypothetical protein
LQIEKRTANALAFRSRLSVNGTKRARQGERLSVNGTKRARQGERLNVVRGAKARPGKTGRGTQAGEAG